MKKLFLIFFATGALATGFYACSKDDNNSSNNNNNNNNNNPPIDVWAKAVGTYVGESSSSSAPTQDNSLVIVEKISDTKVRVKPGAGNTIITLSEFDVYKTDSMLIVAPGGGFDGSLSINVKQSPPYMVFTKNNPNIAFTGSHQ